MITVRKQECWQNIYVHKNILTELKQHKKKNKKVKVFLKG